MPPTNPLLHLEVFHLWMDIFFLWRLIFLPTLHFLLLEFVVLGYLGVLKSLFILPIFIAIWKVLFLPFTISKIKYFTHRLVRFIPCVATIPHFW